MTAENLMPSFQATMAWEGRDCLSLNTADPGNWTGGRVGQGSCLGSIYGVSAATALAHRLTPGKVTLNEAAALFKTNYWDVCGCDEIALGLDHSVSDEAYNAGIAQAQRAYRRLPSNLNTIELIKTFANMRLALFRSFKTWPTFGAGWARRIGGVEAESLRMAMTSTGTPPTAQDAAICEHAKSVKTLAAAHRGSAVKASAGAVAAGAAHQAANGPPSALYLILAIFIVGVGGLLVRASLQKQRALGLVVAIKGATP